jgi:hypothetical protein
MASGEWRVANKKARFGNPKRAFFISLFYGVDAFNASLPFK